MEFREAVRRRRMIHSFEQRPVDRALLDELVDVARRAPSAGFSQGIDFVVLDDPAMLERFWSLTDDPAFPREPGELDAAPPVIVLLLADADRYVARYSAPDKLAFGLDRADAWPVRFWETDAAMAGMVLLLGAVDAGLGSWYFGIGHGAPELRDELGIPPERTLIGVVGIGYAAPEQPRVGSAYSLPRRPLGEQLHHNGW